MRLPDIVLEIDHKHPSSFFRRVWIDNHDMGQAISNIRLDQEGPRLQLSLTLHVGRLVIRPTDPNDTGLTLMGFPVKIDPTMKPESIVFGTDRKPPIISVEDYIKGQRGTSGTWMPPEASPIPCASPMQSKYAPPRPKPQRERSEDDEGPGTPPEEKERPTNPRPGRPVGSRPRGGHGKMGETRASVAAYLQAHEKPTLMGLARALGLTPSTAHYHLKNLGWTRQRSGEWVGPKGRSSSKTPG